MKKIFLSLIIFNLSISCFAQPSEYHLTTLSDIHLGAKQTMDLAPTNTNANNDLDLATFQTFLTNIKNLISIKTLQPNSVLVLGDSVDHISSDSKNGSPEAREIQLTNTFSNLSETFKVPLSYTFGNNDSLLGDYQQFFDNNYVSHSAFDIAEESGWKNGFLSNGVRCAQTGIYPCLSDENQTDGYYSEYLMPKLKLIVLNSVMFEGSHSITYHGKNYNGELDWFNRELTAAHQNKDSVLIGMHVPPGMNLYNQTAFWQQQASTDFMNSIKTYPNDVIGILVGHSHNEEFRFINVNQHIIPVIFTAGLSTSHGNAPAFKDFTLVKDQNNKWILQNYKTYYYVNNQFNLLYDFNSAYCPHQNNMTIEKCLQQYVMQKNLDGLLKIMNQYFTAGNPNNLTPARDTNANDLMIALN